MAVNLLTYGFMQYRHLAAERVTAVGERAIYDAIRESAMEHTRQINSLLGGIVRRTTDFKIRYKQPGDGTLQPITGSSSPIPVRESGYYDVAFPIQGGGTGWGTDRISRAKLTVQEADEITFNNQRRDADWLRRHILAALFTNVAWTYTDELHGSLTVQPLAITSDSVEYNVVGGSKATDEHFLAQANAIDDSNNPFDNIYDELMEHPVNQGPVVVFVPSNLTASIEGLTNFVPVADPDIQAGVASDQLRAAGNVLMGIKGPGDEVLGKTDKCWIVEWRALPSSYMIGVAMGGAPVLAMREHAEPSLQGFFTENHSPDGNLQQTNLLRFAGFGAWNRVGAVAYRIGNGSYAIPSGYTAPLAV